MAQISAIVLFLARAARKVSSWKCEILFCYTGKTETLKHANKNVTKRTSMFVESLKL